MGSGYHPVFTRLVDSHSIRLNQAFVVPTGIPLGHPGALLCLEICLRAAEISFGHRRVIVCQHRIKLAEDRIIANPLFDPAYRLRAVEGRRRSC